MEHQDRPPICAAFLVVFDQKVGYTTAWKRALPDVDLDGVEYKSLPSGLHSVQQDLVYFIHNGYAGISVFVQGEADAKHRNANFVAVGALVPLTYGRLGRAWNHAEELRELASTLVTDASDTRSLELFWSRFRQDKVAATAATGSAIQAASPSSKRQDASSPLESRKRKRALSDATIAGLGSHRALPPDHPALAMPALLDTFGPLLFPLHRAALLRQRVLLLGAPPVQRAANAVYIASILSSIPQALHDSLPPAAEPLLSGRPLFCVGVHDMPSLSLADQSQQQQPQQADSAASSSSSDAGWLACTTDDILGEKKALYDLLVRLPAVGGTKGTSARRAWPELRTADGRPVRATQRDYRRWKLLRRELQRLRRRCMEQQRGARDEAAAAVEDEDEDEDDSRPLLPRKQAPEVEKTAMAPVAGRDASEVVEPASWTALAYRGFMWWASAGEASAWESDETRADEELLFDLPDIEEIAPRVPRGGRASAEGEEEGEDDEEESQAYYARAVATVVVAYFRRLTMAMLKPLAEIVEDADDDTEQGIQEDEIVISMDDVGEMALDTWSATDRQFIKDLGRVWFKRDIAVTDAAVKVCGLRVC